jgi:hypothetical protein
LNALISAATSGVDERLSASATITGELATARDAY